MGNTTPSAHSLIAISLADFLTMPLPERGILLSPIIPTQGIVILFAPRGVGKTFAALSIAVAVAAGGEAFGWRAPAPRKVLYVDGEMPALSMQERFKALATGMALLPHALENLTLVTPDLQPGPMPDFSTEFGQAALEPFLKDMDMVILDNLATLCRTGKENESQSWVPIQTWLLALRRRGLAVMLVHHAGKSGDQRGTSAREDIMDTVINLRRPREYSMAEGARFEVHLTKSRNLAGEEACPFEALLKGENGALYWDVRTLEDTSMETLRGLLAEGKTIRQCAVIMDKSSTSIQRMKHRLEGRA